MVNSEIESRVDAEIIVDGSVKILITVRINTASTTFSARLKFERICNAKAIARVSSEILIGITESKIVKTGVKISAGTMTKVILISVCVKTEINRISTKVEHQFSIKRFIGRYIRMFNKRRFKRGFVYSERFIIKIWMNI